MSHATMRISISHRKRGFRRMSEKSQPKPLSAAPSLKRYSFRTGFAASDRALSTAGVSLQDIFIPAQVSELGCDAFSGCDALTKAQIASSALSIPQGMFQEDRQLRSVRFHPQSQVQKIQKRAFSECKSLTTLILPPGLTEINDHAFYRCKSLDTIQFPEHLRRIGGQAFYFCGFPSIALPDSLEILEESAFFKCTQLTYVRIPKNVRFIGKWAFHGCNRLQYLEIRHDPDFIGEWIINRSATIRCYQGSKVDQYCQASGFKTEYL